MPSSCSPWAERLAWRGVDRLSAWYGNTSTLEWRLTLWHDTMAPLKDFWLPGSGLNTYGTVMLVYPQTDTAFHAQQAHNDYLQLAVEGGASRLHSGAHRHHSSGAPDVAPPAAAAGRDDLVDSDGRDCRYLRHGDTGSVGLQPTNSWRRLAICHVPCHRHSRAGTDPVAPAQGAEAASALQEAL